MSSPANLNCTKKTHYFNFCFWFLHSFAWLHLSKTSAMRAPTATKLAVSERKELYSSFQIILSFSLQNVTYVNSWSEMVRDTYQTLGRNVSFGKISRDNNNHNDVFCLFALYMFAFVLNCRECEIVVISLLIFIVVSHTVCERLEHAMDQYARWKRKKDTEKPMI